MFKLKINQQVNRDECSLPPEITNKQYIYLNAQHKAMVYKIPEVEIKDMAMYFQSPEEIEKLGVKVSIALRDSYDIDKTGTVLDRRMGTTKLNVPCKLCCQTTDTCRGHIGYIVLKHRLINPLAFLEVKLLLQAMCHECGELITDSKLYGSHKERVLEASQLSVKRGVCHNCGNQAYHISLDKVSTSPEHDLFMTNLPVKRFRKEDVPKYMSINDVHNILSNISEHALKKLKYGYTKPSSYVISNLIVPHMQMRPVMLVAGRKISPFNSLYDKIVTYNNRQLNEDNAESIKNRNILYLLIYRLTLGDDSKDIGTEDFSNLKDLLRGKSGIIRGSTMGKRVDYCSRTVLGPGPAEGLGEIGYPYHSSRIVSTPIMVTKYNLNHIQELWKIGTIKAITPGNPFSNRYKQIVYTDETLLKNYSPLVDDIVHKYITSGDSICFNRQPTLTRNSLLGTRSHVDKQVNMYTNRINSSATKPSNADFDGDEGNVYIHQSVGSKLESEFVCNIRQNILGATNGSPQISIEQHGLVGLYLLTRYDEEFDDEDWSECYHKFAGQRGAFINGNFSEISHPDDIKLENISSYNNRLARNNIKKNGKAVVSMLLPKTLNMIKPLYIVNGTIVEGVLNKGSVKHLINHLATYYSQEVAADFITAAQKVADWYTGIFPTTLSLNDVIIPSIMADVEQKYNDTLIKVSDMYLSAEKTGEPEWQLERRVLNQLNIITNIGTKAVELMNATNPIKVLIESGAKGSASNAAQMSSIIGQIVIDGVRPIYKVARSNAYREGTKVLPYSEPIYWPNRKDLLTSRGFERSNYVYGIGIQNIFWSLSSGRADLTTAKLSTAVVGDFSRKLKKTLEEAVVKHDGSIRTSQNKMFSSSYLDGFAPNRLIWSTTPKTGLIAGFADLQILADSV